MAAAIYMATMYARVPKRRSEIAGIVPAAAESVLTELEKALQHWAKITNDTAAVERRLAEFQEVAKSVRSDPLRGAVADLIRSPWPSQKVVNAIAAMTWRVGKATGALFYIAADNPVHFFKGLGIRTARSELTFPISADCAIYASWRGEPGSLRFFQAPDSFVKECNRRIAHGADRFVFSPRNEGWIETIAEKPNPALSAFDW
jgi:hypothetical protein